VVVTGQATSFTLGKGAAQETNAEDMDIVGMFRPGDESTRRGHVGRDGGASFAARAAPRADGAAGAGASQYAGGLWGSLRKSSGSIRRRTGRRRISSIARGSCAHRRRCSARSVRCSSWDRACVRGAEEHVQTLAELVNARVATTPRAKGLVPEDHRFVARGAGLRGARRRADHPALGGRRRALRSGGIAQRDDDVQIGIPISRGPNRLSNSISTLNRVGRNYPVDIPLVGDAQRCSWSSSITCIG